MTVSPLMITFVIFCFAAQCSSAAQQAPECSDFAHGRSCLLHSIAESVAVFDSKVLVGAADHLYSFGRDLVLQDEVPMDAQGDKKDTCTSFEAQGLGRPESECRNFIKVIQRVPSGFETNAVDSEGQIMACGTNAFFPKCTIHDSSSLTNYSYMTSEEDDEGYSPRSHKDPIVAILASNGRFFSATLFQAFQANKNIGMAKNPLRGDSDFNVRAPVSDPLWFNKPDFVSTYEIGEHIYFFLREPAYEVDEGASVVYSRAIRICKSDNGQYPSNSNTWFLTYQKARMSCSSDGERGSIPYNYDNLESTFLWTGSGSEASSTLYGIFSSPDNGPEGSAICKFSFDPSVEGSLTQSFENGHYTVPMTQGGQQVWVTEEPGPFSCPGTTSTTIPQRTVEQSTKYQLIDGSIEPNDPAEPVHIVSGEKMDKIAVDVITYKNSLQEVIYFTTESGDVRQVVYVSGSSQTVQDHVIKKAGGKVNYLSVHQNEDETRQVYLTTEDQIVSITRGDCTQYKDCFECLDSKDAYCGWSPSKKCINKITQSTSDLIEAHSADESKTVSTCGVRTNIPNPPPTVSTSPCSSSLDSDAENTGCSPPNTEGLGNAGSSSKSDMNIPTIVGATVGAFVLGVPVGAFVCFIFFRLFVRPRQAKNYLEEEEDGRVSRQPHTNGDLRLSNVPNGEPVIDPTSTLNKKDLSMSTESHSSIMQHPAPPRYVDVKVQSKVSQLSCSAPTGSNGSPFSASTSNIEMMFKRSSVDVSNTMMNTAVKDDSAFGGSENDLVPPLVHLSGSDGFGTYKKPSKHSKYPMNTNGVSRTQVPGHKVPKGRTPSTTWLRENSISDGSDLSSPLQSPISDV